MTLKDVAYSGITVIFAIAAVMFVYTAMYDLITITLYDMAINSGVPGYIVENLLLCWIWFPVPFIFCCFIWLIYTATISGGTSY